MQMITSRFRGFRALMCLFSLLTLALAAFSAPPVYAATNAPQLLAIKGGSLVIINTAGAVERTVLNGLGDFDPVSWSPDGSKIAVINSTSLRVLNADGSNVKTVATFKLDGNFNATVGQFWAPDNSHLVYWYRDYANNSLSAFKVNPDGSDNQKIFDLKPRYFVSLIGYWPDGKRLLVQEDQDFGLAAPSTIFLSDMSGTSRTKIVDVTNFNTSAKFSPDGTQVIFDNILGGYIASVSNPAATVRQLNSGSTWSSNPGKVIGVNLSKNAIEETDLATGITRTVATTPTLKPFQGGGASVFGLTSDTTGFAAFTNFRVTSYMVNLITGQVRDIGNVGIIGWRPGQAIDVLPEFYNVWRQADLDVALGRANRSWLWGPEGFAARVEDYRETPGGKRQVQYFDKARMELTNPQGDRSNPFFVTNGLLPKELISGQMQIGDGTFSARQPAEVNVAGDAGGSVTYAKLAGVTTLEPGKNVASNRVGQSVTAGIDLAGRVSDRAALPGVQIATFIPETGHNIPNVFWNYFKTLPQDWLFVMGYPLSEPYITEITLAGKPSLAMVQVYERRVLTYTPSNPDPFKVEQGNVGRHYFQWRYPA